VEASGTEGRLRTVVAEGLARLDEAHGGRYMSTVARRLGVERSTVSRWRQQRATTKPEHCEALARNWPRYFDREDLLDLHYQSLQSTAGSGRHTAGVEILTTTAEVLDAATAEILTEPDNPSDRTISHCGFHLELDGRDPLDTNDPFDAGLAAQMGAFRAAAAGRAGDGWAFRSVVSAGRIERLDSIRRLVQGVDGPNVEIYAYAHSLPLVVGPLVVANRVVFMTHDHRRWERPGSAMLVRSRSAADWANRYHSDLIADAPFRLRRPSGIDHDGMRRFEEALAAGHRSG